ncbi:MAG: FAD binding domain-containing protein [Ilumatobacteraceae bacterium]
MSTVIEYHRPTTLEDALRLVAQGGTVLAGGTVVNAGSRPSRPVLVDLQALALAGVAAPDDSTLVIGSMTRLHDLAADTATPDWLRELARRELPSSLRTLGTIGGTIVAGGGESALVAALVACDAIVSLASAAGTNDIALTTLLADLGGVEGRIITSVRLDVSGAASVQSTARTTADTPIVCCVARAGTTGLRVAMSGVAATAVAVDDVDALAPPGDFRGSGEYRRHLARVLQTRAITELGAVR